MDENKLIASQSNEILTKVSVCLLWKSVVTLSKYSEVKEFSSSNGSKIEWGLHWLVPFKLLYNSGRPIFKKFEEAAASLEISCDVDGTCIACKESAVESKGKV